MSLPYSYDHYGDHDALYDHRHQQWQLMEQEDQQQQGREGLYGEDSNVLTSTTSLSIKINLRLTFYCALDYVPLQYVTIDTNQKTFLF